VQLTPQQKDEIRKAKAAGERRVTVTFTPEQKVEWQAAAEQELAAKEENILHFRKLKEAAAKPGLFGDIRRAIAASRLPADHLATQVGIDVRLLSDFRAGDAELPPEALERLLNVLRLRLMQEIGY
jgi:hypothetical protein